jgi:hypothetical protein
MSTIRKLLFFSLVIVFSITSCKGRPNVSANGANGQSLSPNHDLDVKPPSDGFYIVADGETTELSRIEDLSKLWGYSLPPDDINSTPLIKLKSNSSSFPIFLLQSPSMNISYSILEQIIPRSGISVSSYNGQCIIAEVQPNSGALKAGLLVNQVITKIDGKTIGSDCAVRNMLEGHQFFDVVTVTVQQGTYSQDVSVPLLTTNTLDVIQYTTQAQGNFIQIIPGQMLSSGYYCWILPGLPGSNPTNGDFLGFCFQILRK